jgi:hypothetical protein
MLALAEEKRGRRDAAIYHYAKAYRHLPGLANPRLNPLVIDSQLQDEAQLLRYQRDMAAVSIDVPPVDQAAVRAMMQALPEAEPGAPAPPTTSEVTPPPTTPPKVPPPKAPAKASAASPIFGGETPTPTR